MVVLEISSFLLFPLIPDFCLPKLQDIRPTGILPVERIMLIVVGELRHFVRFLTILENSSGSIRLGM